MNASPTKRPKKIRVDERVVARGLADSLDQARRYILAGRIRAGDRVWDKVGAKIPDDTPLTRRDPDCPFVSWGGLKLRHALDVFPISVAGRRCLDLGASTGGFTDVLLKAGARSVAAVDVGQGQLDARLRADARVMVYDKVNVRLAQPGAFGDPFDLIVADVSFISLGLVLPVARPMLTPTGDVIALIKPQFEADRADIPPGGVVTDPDVHRRVITRLCTVLSAAGLFLHGLTEVPRRNGRKNREFPAWWRLQRPERPVDVHSVF